MLYFSLGLHNSALNNLIDC